MAKQVDLLKNVRKQLSDVEIKPRKGSMSDYFERSKALIMKNKDELESDEGTEKLIRSYAGFEIKIYNKEYKFESAEDVARIMYEFDPFLPAFMAMFNGSVADNYDISYEKVNRIVGTLTKMFDGDIDRLTITLQNIGKKNFQGELTIGLVRMAIADADS